MINLVAKNIHKMDTQDGYAWDASFYLDGKKIGIARNGGYGGPTETRDIDPDALKVLEAYAAKTPPHNDFKFEQVEALLESVMLDTLEIRRTKSLLKRKVIFQTGKDIRECDIKKGVPVERILHYVMGKYPNAEILNTMEIEKASRLLNPIA